MARIVIVDAGPLIALAGTDNLGSGSPLNRTKLREWNILVPALIILGPWASSKPGSGPMRTAWTTWSGFAGLAVLSAQCADMREVGGWATVGSGVAGVVVVRR